MRRVMTKARWGALSAFDWYEEARRRWLGMTDDEREAVWLCSEAELRANDAYNAASAAVLRARGRHENLGQKARRG